MQTSGDATQQLLRNVELVFAVDATNYGEGILCRRLLWMSGSELANKEQRDRGELLQNGRWRLDSPETPWRFVEFAVRNGIPCGEATFARGRDVVYDNIVGVDGRGVAWGWRRRRAPVSKCGCAANVGANNPASLPRADACRRRCAARARSTRGRRWGVSGLGGMAFADGLASLTKTKMDEQSFLGLTEEALTTIRGTGADEATVAVAGAAAVYIFFAPIVNTTLATDAPLETAGLTSYDVEAAACKKRTANSQILQGLSGLATLIAPAIQIHQGLAATQPPNATDGKATPYNALDDVAVTTAAVSFLTAMLPAVVAKLSCQYEGKKKAAEKPSS